MGAPIRSRTRGGHDRLRRLARLGLRRFRGRRRPGAPGPRRLALRDHPAARRRRLRLPATPQCGAVRSPLPGRPGRRAGRPTTRVALVPDPPGRDGRDRRRRRRRRSSRRRCFASWPGSPGRPPTQAYPLRVEGTTERVLLAALALARGDADAAEVVLAPVADLPADGQDAPLAAPAQRGVRPAGRGPTARRDRVRRGARPRAPGCCWGCFRSRSWTTFPAWW